MKSCRLHGNRVWLPGLMGIIMTEPFDMKGWGVTKTDFNSMSQNFFHGRFEIVSKIIILRVKCERIEDERLYVWCITTTFSLRIKIMWSICWILTFQHTWRALPLPYCTAYYLVSGILDFSLTFKDPASHSRNDLNNTCSIYLPWCHRLTKRKRGRDEVLPHESNSAMLLYLAERLGAVRMFDRCRSSR